MTDTADRPSSFREPSDPWISLTAMFRSLSNLSGLQLFTTRNTPKVSTT